MRAFRFLLLLFIIFSVSAGAASPAGEDRAGGRNSLWQSEVQLARTPQIYLLFALADNKIWVKARGIVLREMPVASCSVWGTPVPPNPLVLLSKSAIRKPQRTEIKPAPKEEQDTSAPPAIQVEDMPARYRLNFAGGIRIYVRPVSAGVLSTVLNLFAGLKSFFATRPIGFLWNQIHGESFTEIAVQVSERDAQSLYWAFQEGSSCIIWSP
jgi:hypothetical protein